MKKLLIIPLLFLLSCSKKETPTPQQTPSTFTGNYTKQSGICSNPSYTNWAEGYLDLVQNGTSITIPVRKLNVGIDLPVTAYVSGTTATMSSFTIDAHHKFSGGTMSISGNTLTVKYSFSLFYDTGALLSKNDYDLVYTK